MKWNNRRRLVSEVLEDRNMLSATVFEHDDVGYFLASSEPQIERYDIENERWLSSISLADGQGTPTVATVDDDGIYVAYGKAVYRYSLDGTNQTHLLNANDDIISLHTDGDLLFLNHSASLDTRLVVIDKPTNTVLNSYEDYLDTIYGASIAPGVNRIIGRSRGISPADITYVEYTDAGEIVRNGDSPYHGDYPGGTEVWVFPNDARVVDSSGTVYATESLTWLGSFGSQITDIDFLGDDVPIVLHDRTLKAFNAAYLPTGSHDLSQAATDIFVNDNSVITFAPNSAEATGYSANVVPISSLNPPEPGEAVDPVGLPYTPDKIEISSDGDLLIFSKSLQSVFRWDPLRQTYGETIPLIGVPDYMAYSATNDTIYLAYQNGLIRKVDLGESTPREVPFTTLPEQPIGLSTAGEYVFAADPAGAWVSHYVFSPDGTLIDSADWNRSSTEFIWNEVNRRMYFFRDGTSPNDLHFEEITRNGMIGNDGDSPLHGSEGFRYPIRVSPDGSVVVLGSGKIHDGITMERRSTALANEILDAAWLNGRLFTVRAVAGVTQYQTWDAPTYALVETVQADDAPLALLAVPGWERMVGVSHGDGGVPTFTVLDDTLTTITPEQPYSIAGVDLMSLVGESVSLDGSASIDPDNSPSPLAYTWSVISGPGTGTFSAEMEAATDFTASEAGQYIVQLTVSDGVNSDTDQLTVTARTNAVPVLDTSATMRSTIDGAGPVTLDASATTDPDGDPMSFDWGIVTAPEGSSATISHSDRATTSLNVDVPGDYVVQVTANDGFVDATETIAISVRTNQAPTADASDSETQTIAGGSPVTLDATTSSDPDGDALTYSWAVSDRPAGSFSSVVNRSEQIASFVPDVAGIYAVDLTVTDGVLEDVTTVVVVARENSAPTAVIQVSREKVVANGHPVDFDASQTLDPDGDAVTYSWELTASPEGSTPLLENSNEAIATFTTDAPGSYSVRVTASDGILTDSESLTFDVTLNNRPTADASLSDAVVTAGQSAALDSSQSDDEDGDPLTYVWIVTGQPDGSSPVLSSEDEAIAQLETDLPGFYAVRLTVSDGLESHTDTIVIVANGTTTENRTPVADASLSDTRIGLNGIATLDASRSQDPDDDSLTYTWSVVESPQSSVPSIGNVNESMTEFSTDIVGTYRLQLLVSDGTATDSTEIEIFATAENSPPAADASNTSIFNLNGQDVVLDASLSSDPDGDDLQYSWMVVSSTSGSIPAIETDADGITQLAMPAVGVYAIELTVSDGQASATDLILISIDENNPPIADASLSGTTGTPGVAVPLDASLSTDAEGQDLTYMWQTVASPDGSSVEIVGETEASAQFIASTAGEYTIELTVHDGVLESTTFVVVAIESANAEGSWHNSSNPLDVDNNNTISPLDALLIINELTDRVHSNVADGKLHPIDGNPVSFFDVDNNGFVSPIDALNVINALGGQEAAAALPDEFESTRSAVPPDARSGDWLISADRFWNSYDDLSDDLDKKTSRYSKIRGMRRRFA